MTTCGAALALPLTIPPLTDLPHSLPSFNIYLNIRCPTGVYLRWMRRYARRVLVLCMLQGERAKTMRHAGNRKGTVTLRVLIAVGFVLVIAATADGVYLLTSMARDLSEVSSKLDKLDSMTLQMQHMSTGLSRFDKTNDMLTSVDRSTRFLPALTAAAKRALTEAIASDRKLQVVNTRLAATNLYMRSAADRLTATNGALTGMRRDMAHMGGSMDKMAGELVALDDMRRLLALTNADLGQTVKGIGQMTTGVGEMTTGLDEMRAQMRSMNAQLAALEQVSKGIDKMQTRLESMNSQLGSLPQLKGGLDEMQAQLKIMNTQMAVLPQMKQSLDQTNTTLSSTMLTLEPLGQALPQMNTSMQQMNQTTTEMARSLRKLPGQGALGVAALVAAELFGGGK